MNKVYVHSVDFKVFKRYTDKSYKAVDKLGNSGYIPVAAYYGDDVHAKKEKGIKKAWIADWCLKKNVFRFFDDRWGCVDDDENVFIGDYHVCVKQKVIENMERLGVKAIYKGEGELTYATPQSAGLDLRANNDEPIELKPLERKLIPTGLFLALPEGYEAQIRPRSGLALKKGITVLNAPGTVDADYRGEVGVILINMSNEPFVIEKGERIAQMVIARHEQAELILVDVLDETERGAGGYGHTGVK